MTVHFSHNSHIARRRGGLVKTGVIGGLAVFVGFALFASLVVFAVGGIFVVTRPVVEASERFLGMLGEGKISAAYAAGADGLRVQQSEASFARAVTQLGLTDYASVSWRNREINNRNGIAEGTVHTKSGDKKPVLLRLVHENGEWRVVSVRFGGLELALFGDESLVPSTMELERLATETLLGFNQAVKSRDFNDFYVNLSQVWQQQTTPEQLQQTFQPFIDKNVDIAAIGNVRPQLTDPASIVDQGVLLVAGEYPTQPHAVRFKLEYVGEPAGWKLLGISVNVGP